MHQLRLKLLFMHQLRFATHQLFDRVVTAIAAILFGYLVIYIYQDLFQNKISALDNQLSEVIDQFTLIAGLFLIFMLKFQSSHFKEGKSSFDQLQSFFEFSQGPFQRSNLWFWRTCYIVLNLLPIIILSALIVPPAVVVLIALLCSGLDILSLYMRGMGKKKSAAAEVPSAGDNQPLFMHLSPFRIRLKQMQRQLGLYLPFAVAITVICVLVARLVFSSTCLSQSQIFQIFLLNLFAGLLLALAILFRIKQDSLYHILEKSAGLSHSQYVSSYFKLSFMLGGALLAMQVMAFSKFWIYANPQCSANGGTGLTHATALTLMLVSTIAPIMTPAMMFQIDPRQPVLQFMIIGLISFLIGSLTFMHPGFYMLLILVIALANHYQQDRYYYAFSKE